MIIGDAIKVAETATKLWKHVTKAEDKKAARRILAFLDTKRVLFDRNQWVPYACYESVKMIFNKLAEERGKLPSPELMDALRDMQNVCNSFKRTVEEMGLCEDKQSDVHLSQPERENLRNALQAFREEIGIRIAAMGVNLRIPVPEPLVVHLPLSLFPELKTTPL